MKRSILAVFATAAAVFSCSEQEKTPLPDLVTSTVEVTLGNASTKAFADNTTEEWEKKVNNIAMFVYKTGETKCAYQRQFTVYEIGKGKAVFAIPDVAPVTAYDFYAVANCDFTTEMGSGGAGVTRDALIAKMEGTDAGALVTDAYGSLASYNKVDVSAEADWTAITTSVLRNTGENKGFVMTGKATVTTAADGSNIPTRVTIEMGRTVAKVAVVAATSNATTKPGDDNFKAKYPDATFKITKMTVTKLAEKTTLIAPAIYEVAAFGTATSWSQVPNVLPVAGTTPEQFRSLFYMYENSNGTAAVGDAAFKPVLELEADFDYDGESSTTIDISHIKYTIKLSGEAAAAAETDPKFGLFKRNGSYLVKISIDGLTENEVVTEVQIKDWEAMKEQNVNIGDEN